MYYFFYFLLRFCIPCDDALLWVKWINWTFIFCVSLFYPFIELCKFGILDIYIRNLISISLVLLILLVFCFSCYILSLWNYMPLVLFYKVEKDLPHGLWLGKLVFVFEVWMIKIYRIDVTGNSYATHMVSDGMRLAMTTVYYLVWSAYHLLEINGFFKKERSTAQ